MTAGEPVIGQIPSFYPPPLPRAQKAEELVTAVQQLVTSFIQAADDNASSTSSQYLGLDCPAGKSRSGLLEYHPPLELQQLLNLTLPEHGLGKDGFLQMVQRILQYSVNTWDQGFLDKLYAATTPVGLAADLLLSSLNTNVHVYQVSPALTIIEKQTGKALANMFGFHGAYAGGITQPGGSAANQSSMVIARNTLYPETKTKGNGTRKFVLFTSAHGHYSVEKAAQMFGFGSDAVRSIAVDDAGRMRPELLSAAIQQAKEAGETPFYVNATAGTTVLGSFDPLDAIAPICRHHNLWLHVDGSWGGSLIFSPTQRPKLRGVEHADSLTLCAHKMLNVPLPCTYLLTRDLRAFHAAMTLPAAYLFHQNDAPSSPDEDPFHDLADLTPQCGRRGDALKLALTWLYHGSAGLADHVDRAFARAARLAARLDGRPPFCLVSPSPPPCMQVCFYIDKKPDPAQNTATTKATARELLRRGYMVDYAPGEDGVFLRVVTNGGTRVSTVEGLMGALEEIGAELGRREGGVEG